jgi:hypothetical protein
MSFSIVDRLKTIEQKQLHDWLKNKMRLIFISVSRSVCLKIKFERSKLLSCFEQASMYIDCNIDEERRLLKNQRLC